MMQEMVERFGYEIKSYENGQEGLIALSTYKPDVILTDMMMPEMDGYKFMQEYYAGHMVDVRAPVELITGYTPESTLGSIRVLGQSIYDYLAITNEGFKGKKFAHMEKPISLALLKEKLSSVEDALRA